ncbi:MAG: hypothetical protein IJM79_01190 [Erysipelotrichaceae bacterium]|nr:hypothetical protein [Erysipelotrichaceae bacterium]
METLAVKYRPQKFEDVCDQNTMEKTKKQAEDSLFKGIFWIVDQEHLENNDPYFFKIATNYPSAGQ